jgi:diguanylate cyclase (GGDEF)-like protein
VGLRGQGPIIFAGVFVSYLALAQLVLWLNDPVRNGAGLWPAAGLSLAALLLLPTRLWGWVLSAVALAEIGGDLAHGYPVLAALGWAVGNAVEPLLGAMLLRQLGNGDGRLAPMSKLVLFLACGVVVGPLVGATIGTVTSVLSFDGQFFYVWPRYVVGDALGVLVVAPVLLCLRSPRVVRHPGETVALTVGSLAASIAVFGDIGGRWTATMPYVLTPFLMWAALRYGVRGTAMLALALTLIGNGYTATGNGPFDSAVVQHELVVPLLQTFLGISVASALLLAAAVSDLTSRRQLEAALRDQASRDALTGLPNRVSMREAVVSALDHRSVHGGSVALLLCDIDHLKTVNDTMGHSAGDQLIAAIADRLRLCVRADDLVARISGDEFLVLVSPADGEQVAALCARIQDAVPKPVAVGERTVQTPSVSIGAALSVPGSTVTSLFNNADTALYEAKRQGRARTVRFDERLRLQVRERQQVEADLPRALVEGQVHCVYQPEVVLATGELFGFESLARWAHPQRGLIMPDHFIAAVEATGKAGELFELVLKQTLAAQEGWTTVLGTAPPVAVNMSAMLLNDRWVVETVAAALVRANASAASLSLEVTESALASGDARATLSELHDLGVLLAVDDFGTGWSSFSRLASYPWDLLKLDRSFIGRLGEDDGAEHVVSAMVAMAHALGIPTVAEGVETQRQLDYVIDMGCDIAQGYFFSRPVSAVEAVVLVDGAGRFTGRPPVRSQEPRHATAPSRSLPTSRPAVGR